MQNLPFFSLINMEYILFSVLSHSVVPKHISRNNSYRSENEEQVTSYMLPIGDTIQILAVTVAWACTVPWLHLTSASCCWEPSKWQQHQGKGGENQARERKLRIRILPSIAQSMAAAWGSYTQRWGFLFLLWNLILWGQKETFKILYPQRTSFAVLNHPKDHGVYLHSAIELGQVVIINL